MSAIRMILLALAFAVSFASGSAFAQAPTLDKASKPDHVAKKKECKQQAEAKKLTGPERNAFEGQCEGKPPKSKKK